MNTRRDALRILTTASAALPSLASAAQQTQEVEDQPGHVHTGPSFKIAAPGKPNFFQPAEFRTLEELTECIIPRSDTPGSKDVGVALLIDKAVLDDRTLSQPYRAGLADLNAAAVDAYGLEFVALSEEQKLHILTPMSLEADSDRGKFFAMVKDMTVDAYYKTEAGLVQELGWHGNTYLATFPAAPILSIKAKLCRPSPVPRSTTSSSSAAELLAPWLPGT